LIEAHVDLLPSPAPTRLKILADHVDTWLGSHRSSYLVVASITCLLTFAGYAHAKVPWMDEVLLLTIARLKDLHQIWASLMDGIQTDPPVLQTIVHFLFQTFGEHVLLARLPAILGFCLMCASLAILVWRHAPPVYAAATFFLPYATVLRVWSMDARPYGMMMGLSALTLLCWDGYGNPASTHRTRWRIAFTLSLAATLSTHFYSILLLGPLAAGELTRWVLRRKADWLTVGYTVLALIPYACWLPILLSGMRVFQVSSRHYHGHVSFDTFATFYSWAIPSLPLIGVFFLMLAALLLIGRTADNVPPARLSDRQRGLLAAALGFLMLPAVGYAAGLLATGFFIVYYHMIATFGVIIGFPLLLSAITGRSQVVGLCLLVPIAGQALLVTARGMSDFRRRDIGYPTLASMRALIPAPHPDIVIAAPALFLPTHDVNRFDPEDDLLFLFDRHKALDEMGTNTADILYDKLRPYTNARIEPFDTYTATHGSYYLAMPADSAIEAWQYSYLVKRQHARLWWLGTTGLFDLYRVDSRVGER
jgi:hypothetical protein